MDDYESWTTKKIEWQTMEMCLEMNDKNKLDRKENKWANFSRNLWKEDSNEKHTKKEV